MTQLEPQCHEVKLTIACAPHLTHAAFVNLGDNRILSNRCVRGYGFAHRLINLADRLLFSLLGVNENYELAPRLFASCP
jgi:hypothetical protein